MKKQALLSAIYEDKLGASRPWLMIGEVYFMRRSLFRRRLRRNVIFQLQYTFTEETREQIKQAIRKRLDDFVEVYYGFGSDNAK